MTDTLLHETRLSLTALAKKERVSVPTTWRWAQRGVRGHVLESFSVGGRRYTTAEAYSRWISALNGEKVIGPETPRQREQAVNRAEREAKKLGV